MRGWRARLGIIIPSLNSTTEPEFYAMAPPGVTFHFDRMGFEQTDAANFEGMVRDVPEAVRRLSHCRVDALAFGCTSGSLYGGINYQYQLIAQMQAIYPVPATTTSSCMVQALQALGISRLSVATPYVDWVNDLERKFLEGSGFEVLSLQGLQMTGFEVGEVHPETLYRFARGACAAGSQALFISCMGLRSLELVAPLEYDLGIPVLSSNLVTCWGLLRLVGLTFQAAQATTVGRLATLPAVPPATPGSTTGG